MAYTDKELQIATQIAYTDFQYAFDVLEAKGQKAPFTIKKLSEVKINGNKIDISHITKAQEKKDVSSWKIASVHDTNDENGFYACVIETDTNNAIVSFRGSENMLEPDNFKNDWWKADFSLLNSGLTEQQKEVENYLDELINDGILNSYQNIASTGHSLGGNLAEHFTVMASGTELSDKLNQSVSFDGPGFSIEYIKKHANLIKKACGKLKHYQWSGVGTCLYPLPGDIYEILNIKRYEDTPGAKPDDILAKTAYYAIARHATSSLIFNEDESAERGDIDLVSVGIYGLTKVLDAYLYGQEAILYSILTVEEIKFYEEFKNKKEKIVENIIYITCYGLKLTTEEFDVIKKQFMKIFNNVKNTIEFMINSGYRYV